MESTPSISTAKGLESLPDENESILSDQTSLTNSLSHSLTFSPAENDETETNNNDAEASALIVVHTPSPEPKKSRPSLFKQKTLPSNPIFDTFDSDLTRAYYRLENLLSKSSSQDSKRFDSLINSIDSQLADIRLMIDCEKDCSLLESFRRNSSGSTQDRQFKSTLNDCHQQILKLIFEQYINANTIMTQENGKNK